MKHRWMGAGLLALAHAASACAPTQGTEPHSDASSVAPAATTTPPSQSEDAAPPTQGSYDY